MEILVIGGNGFIGKNIVRALEENHKVSMLSRKSTVSSNETYGDITDSESLQSLKGRSFDVVVNCVGISPITYHSDEMYYDAHVKGVENIIKVMQQFNFGKLVHISAIGNDIESTFTYMRTKALAEDRIINSGLNYLIIRPSHVLGSGNEFERLIKKLSFIKISLMPRIGGEFNPIHIEDLAEYVSSRVNKGFTKEIVEVVGPRTVRLYEIISENAEILGLKSYTFPFPKVLTDIFVKLVTLLRIVNKNMSEYIWKDNLASGPNVYIGTKDYLRKQI